MSNSTGMYCTNCFDDLNMGQTVIIVDHGVISEGHAGSAYVEADDAPFLQALCEECGNKLALQVEPRPNRVVVEVYNDMAWGHVRAERPEEVVVIMHPLSEGYDLVYGGPNGLSIGKLNTVESTVGTIPDNREPKFACLACGTPFVTPIKKGEKPFLFPTCPACESSAISSIRNLEEGIDASAWSRV